MNKSMLLLVVIAALLNVGEGHDLIVGTGFNHSLIWQQKQELNALPLTKRIKNVFFKDLQERVIKGIIARDLTHSGASAAITSGGIGFSFVNLRLVSQRGATLKYNIVIYA